MIDYDVGDLVVCVYDGPDIETGLPCRFSFAGQVLCVAEIVPEWKMVPARPAFRSTCEPKLEMFSGTILRACYRFRKLPNKSQAFFTGGDQQVSA